MKSRLANLIVRPDSSFVRLLARLLAHNNALAAKEAPVQ